MNGFLVIFQHRLNGIVAEAEALRPLCQKTHRHLSTFHGPAEQDVLFVMETFCQLEEGQFMPCSVPHAHPPQNAAGLGEMRHGM